jgi:hypothetical protein
MRPSARDLPVVHATEFVSPAHSGSDETLARLSGFGRLNGRTRFGSRESLDSALVRRGPRLGLRCSGWAHRRTGFAAGQPWNSGAAIWLGAARSLPSRLVRGLGKCCGRCEHSHSGGQDHDLPHGVSFRVPNVRRGKLHGPPAPLAQTTTLRLSLFLTAKEGRKGHTWQAVTQAFRSQREAKTTTCSRRAVRGRAECSYCFMNVLLDPQHRHRIDQHSPNFGRAHRRRWGESFRGSQTGRWLSSSPSDGHTGTGAPGNRHGTDNCSPSFLVTITEGHHLQRPPLRGWPRWARSAVADATLFSASARAATVPPNTFEPGPLRLRRPRGPVHAPPTTRPALRNGGEP